MPARVVKLIDFEYRGHQIDTLWVILDDLGSPPLLPLFFTLYLSRFGEVYEGLEIVDESSDSRFRSLVTREVTDNTIRSYIYNLAQFLSYLDTCKASHQTPGMHASSACSQRFVNHYINQILATSLVSSQSLNVHQSSLSAYFNFLEYMGITSPMRIRICRKTRQYMAEKSTKQNYFQYVSKCHRIALLNNCETLAEKLMMRMGFEVGLRTSELMGLRTSGENNLCELFDQLDNPEFLHLVRFGYELQGRYTKGSRSRKIYFERSLLVDMKRYFNTERRWLADQTKIRDFSFFLRTDQRFAGTGISEEQASRVFRKRAKEAGLNPQLSFHDLRHTFATELYHAELKSPDGRENRSESAALLAVGQRLGHASGRNGQATPVTSRYIRMRLQMLEVEGIFHEQNGQFEE